MKNKSVNHINVVCKYLSKEDEQAGIITGIGSKYGNVDHAGDVMMPGSFKKSIQERAGKGFFPILWQHDWDKPIGVIKEIREDSDGLKIKAQLNLDTQLGREAHSLSKMGALGGFSVGFYIEKFNIKNDVREITEGQLLEVSLVTFPCNEQAVIETVKSQFNNSIKAQPLIEASNILRSEIKTLQTTKVTKSEHLDVLQEILALITGTLGDANTEVEQEMFDTSESNTSTDQADDQAANQDVSNDGASTEEEPVAKDVFKEEELKMLHSILQNLNIK